MEYEQELTYSLLILAAVINIEDAEAQTSAARSRFAALMMRISNPVQRIISTFDDYFSWLVTFLPVITGLVATSHLGARYETLLGLHILSVALMLIWLPFGKLMHCASV